MTITTYLTKDSLFLKLPTEPTTNSITLHDLYADIVSSSTSYDSIINKTYYLLKTPLVNTNTNVCLKLWQIRLTCHLFNNTLNYAKKELINLNNSLYLQENHNISPSTLNSLGGQGIGGGGQNNPIYPLPKNNLMIIDYKLLILLLRLKNFPNLNLTNELYKLIWQLRLKNTTNENNEKCEDMNVILENLSFDNVVILIITKNYLTLMNFLYLLIKELKELDSSKESQYYSNVCLIYVIVNLLVYCKQKKVNGIIDEVRRIWDEEINQVSKDSLNYALQTITPIVTLQPAPTKKKCETIDDLVDLVNTDAITGRIICSTLGIWDLTNGYGFKLSHSEDGIEFTTAEDVDQEPEDVSSLSDEQLVNKCSDVLSNEWCKYINKVYGLE
ncbi:hypothetical protein Cantr_04138 [Candida viswanathii]|uniref:Uncharacterized protein n=1 Tax=Candida viswanathii TaxID=5486 RepID=A0A367XMH8_9ASCO|nr:hypothetical protein Cantr_04138 [Candida viswanathii]